MLVKKYETTPKNIDVLIKELANDNTSKEAKEMLKQMTPKAHMTYQLLGAMTDYDIHDDAAEAIYLHGTPSTFLPALVDALGTRKLRRHAKYVLDRFPKSQAKTKALLLGTKNEKARDVIYSMLQPGENDQHSKNVIDLLTNRRFRGLALTAALKIKMGMSAAKYLVNKLASYQYSNIVPQIIKSGDKKIMMQAAASGLTNPRIENKAYAIMLEIAKKSEEKAYAMIANCPNSEKHVFLTHAAKNATSRDFANAELEKLGQFSDKTDDKRDTDLIKSTVNRWKNPSQRKAVTQYLTTGKPKSTMLRIAAAGLVSPNLLGTAYGVVMQLSNASVADTFSQIESFPERQPCNFLLHGLTVDDHVEFVYQQIANWSTRSVMAEVLVDALPTDRYGQVANDMLVSMGPQDAVLAKLLQRSGSHPAASYAKKMLLGFGPSYIKSISVMSGSTLERKKMALLEMSA